MLLGGLQPLPTTLTLAYCDAPRVTAVHPGVLLRGGGEVTVEVDAVPHPASVWVPPPPHKHTPHPVFKIGSSFRLPAPFPPS